MKFLQALGRVHPATWAFVISGAASIPAALIKG
jgi:hypothetical protein